MRFAPSGGDKVIGHRDIMVAADSVPVKATIYDRAALPQGFAFAGPAIIQQSDTTTLVEPGWDGTVDEAGNLILTRAKE
jgi:N-methylhydantoinase A